MRTFPTMDTPCATRLKISPPEWSESRAGNSQLRSWSGPSEDVPRPAHNHHPASQSTARPGEWEANTVAPITLSAIVIAPKNAPATAIKCRSKRRESRVTDNRPTIMPNMKAPKGNPLRPTSTPLLFARTADHSKIAISPIAAQEGPKQSRHKRTGMRLGGLVARVSLSS